MKLKIILAVLFFGIITLSCTREEEVMLDSVTGEWKWVSTLNEATNQTETPASTGKQRKLILTSDKNYKMTENDSVVSDGTYSVQKIVYYTDHYDRTYLSFSDDPGKVVVSSSEVSMILGDNFAGGKLITYEK